MKHFKIEIAITIGILIMLIGIPILLVDSINTVDKAAKKECGGFIKCLGKGSASIIKDFADGVEQAN